MDWFLNMFLAQFLFGIVFYIAPVSASIGAPTIAATGIGATYSYKERIGKRIIQNYIDEDVGPFKSTESVSKEAIFGDLIEFDRYHEFFNHWAISIGNGKVADPFVLENIQIAEIFTTTRALVLFSKLTEVNCSDCCRVNNKVRSAKTHGLKPLSDEEIRESIQKSNKEGFDYNVFKYNCEHKVTEWKFGVPFSDQADAVEGMANKTLKSIKDVLTSLCDASFLASTPSFRSIHKIVEIFVDEDVGQFLKPQLVLQEVKLYDIIEIRRSGYSHYAIYVGNGYVQHLSHEYNIFKTVFETRYGRILREKLIDVTGKDLCRVNNKKRSAKSRGLVSQEPQQIKTYLNALENTILEYSIYSYNCEHIVTQWKFGKAFSDQVDALEKIGKETAKIATGYLLYAYTGQTFNKYF